MFLVLLIIILFSSGAFSLYYFNTNDYINYDEKTVFEFKDSEWNYIPSVGFVTDDVLEFLDKQAFAERSSAYFLGEIN